MIKRTACLLAALAVLGLAPDRSVNAQSIFGGQDKLDPAFCKPRNIRETVIYVDDSILVTNEETWFRALYEKLAATLVPGERTTLVQLSPATGRSTERWSGCWPAYSAAETIKLSNQITLFSTDPLKGLKQQQDLFARGIGVALRVIEKVNPRDALPTVDPENPPQRSLIRALVSDEARYAHSQTTIRAIMYSDLVENSDLGSSLKSLPSPPVNYGSKLGTYLRRSVFYVFGVGRDLKSAGVAQDNIRTFWNEAFRSMGANVAGLGSDLNVPNVTPTIARNYDLLLKDGGETLAGRMALLVDNDGALVDSWLGIVRLRSASMTGTFRCTSKAQQSCALQATTIGGVATMSPSEFLSMSSPDISTLTGTIGVPGSAVNLPLAASEATD